MDELLKFITNEVKDSTLITKANSFVGKNLNIQKPTMQILKQIKLISPKLKQIFIRNESFA
jgi:hypothetical protein